MLSQNLKPLCLLETPNAGLLPTLTLALVLAIHLHVANSRAPVASVGGEAFVLHQSRLPVEFSRDGRF